MISQLFTWMIISHINGFVFCCGHSCQDCSVRSVMCCLFFVLINEFIYFIPYSRENSHFQMVSWMLAVIGQNKHRHLNRRNHWEKLVYSWCTLALYKLSVDIVSSNVAQCSMTNTINHHQSNSISQHIVLMEIQQKMFMWWFDKAFWMIHIINHFPLNWLWYK